MDRRLDIAPAMIHRTRTSEIRLGTFDYTRVAVRTYRDNIPQAQALWQATVQQLDAIQRFKHPVRPSVSICHMLDLRACRISSKR